MNKITSLLIAILIFSISVMPVVNAEVKLDAKSAILVDMGNGMTLYEKEIDEKIQPAGFTKIVTALVVLENCEDLSQVITAPSKTISECDFSFGNMGVLADENLSAQALLEGMLLYDAAEAAEVLAGFTFGNYQKFITAMNTLAENVGAQDTNFVNAGGYYDEKQYTTVSDISKIALYAMKNEAFAQIVKKDMVEIAPTNKYRQTRYLSNTNMFMGKNRSQDFYSPKVFGVKTSYMKDHGYGLCIAFENSRGKFLSVTAKGENATAAHTDAQTLRNYVVEGFTNVKLADKGDIIEEVEVPNGRISHVLLKTADELSVRLPADYDKSKIFKWTTKNSDLKAPIEKDEILGSLNISYDGKNVGSVSLIAYEAVKSSPGKSINLIITAIFTSPFFYVPVIAFIVWFGAMVYKAYKAKTSKRKR